MTGLLLVILPSAIASPAKDTALLSARLKTVRGENWLPDDEYSRVQKEYLAWIDSRLKAGVSEKSMNRELQAAGLLERWPKTTYSEAVDEVNKSHAGYLDPISAKPVRAAKSILVSAAGVYRGSGCSRDVTAVIYQRRPLKRLAYLNADPSEPFYLSGLDVSEEGSTGERTVASGWVASNCSSTWNGKRIRIDRLKGSSDELLLARDLDAQDRDQGENVAARVERDVVTFWYQGAIDDDAMLSGPAVASYKIVSGHAVLASPVALTRAGFIHEWLLMADADAARWGEPEAMAMHPSAVSSIVKHGFEWERIAQCGGSPPVWEIAVRPHDSKTVEVFRIGGVRAAGLRMLAVADTVTLSCDPEDISKSLRGVSAELPW
jgi:hypothetical protein